MRVEITRCDQCKAEILPGHRRFVFIARLAIFNGHERDGQVSHTDICSEDCLHMALTALTRGVEEMK